MEGKLLKALASTHCLKAWIREREREVGEGERTGKEEGKKNASGGQRRANLRYLADRLPLEQRLSALKRQGTAPALC